MPLGHWLIIHLEKVFIGKEKKKKQYREREMGSSYIFFNLLNLSRSNSKKKLLLMLIF